MIEQKLKELQIEIPEAPAPLAAYVPAVKAGSFVFTAGQVPIVNGNLIFKGKVPSDVSLNDAIKAAEVSVINCLGAVKSVVGNLEKIKKIVKVTVYVNSADGFTDQPKVANGASELLGKIFGKKAKHARSAVGVNELPLNSTVEIELVAEIDE